MEDKLNKPKLALNKNINADIKSRLNMLAGKSDILGKNQANKSQSNTSALHNNKSVANQDKHNKLSDNRDTAIKEQRATKTKDKAVKDQQKKEQQQQDKQTKHNEEKKEKDEKKSKQHKTISFKGLLSKLKQTYPTTFPSDETKIVALKVGINKDIKDNADLMSKLGISITYLGKFLKWYTSSKNYRMLTQIEGSARYNLQGGVEGIVTKDQALDIQKRLQHSISNNSISESNKETASIQDYSDKVPKNDSDN